MQLAFEDVTFFYDTSSDPVLGSIDLRLSPGWTGLVGANGSGKTTLLRLACGELEPDAGRIFGPQPMLYCPQRTDDPPLRLADLLGATDRAACVLAGRLGLDEDWLDRWDTLSHGERKRAQIAVALWCEPALLAVDEPTNHVDREARDLLLGALRSFRGIGLLVSHDRELLDTLCGSCLFVESGAATLRTGGYTQASGAAREEERHARARQAIARKELSRLKGEYARRKREASGADRKRSKRGLDPKDHDARAKIDLARVTGRDAKAAELMKQMEGRVSQADAGLRSIDAKKERRLGIRLGGDRSRADRLLFVPAGEIDLGGGKTLRHPEITVAPEDRIGLTGPNGAGKSTLLGRLLQECRFPAERLVSLDQEIPRESARAAVRAVRALPRKELGAVLTVVSRLGSDPERILDTGLPSPGEARKLILALGMARSPWLVVMDEPTNHLDLPSIECLEAALEECPAALLLVSHDLRFLERLTEVRWEIEDSSGEGSYELRCR